MSSIRFGISRLPPEDVPDEQFLDELVAKGHRALELPFVDGFPWKEKRCHAFGELAAERDIRLSVHAPYFAGLTLPDEDRGRQSLAALEHTMKLGKALTAPVIVAHFGSNYSEEPDVLMDRIRSRLDSVVSKVESLGVGMGLETAGNNRSFGSLGDIAMLASEYSFVRPVVDWAHVHAMTGGGLTSKEAFVSVFSFIQSQFPGWMIAPLQTQFSDNEFGAGGEIRHIAYGEGTLRVGPLVEAAQEAGVGMVLISEARDLASHDRIWDEARTQIEAGPMTASGRPVFTAKAPFPAPVTAIKEGDGFKPVGLDRPLRLSNLDKVYFPDEGYTKGDLIQYYASVAPVLLPHLAGRPISMSRYPEGIKGQSFYEKRAPGHQPDWMRTTPVPSDSQGGVIDFLVADTVEALMWFANMGCIETHPFHSREGRLEHPDYAIFDFDPAEGSSWDQVVEGGQLLNVALGQLGLVGYPKLSGARGSMSTSPSIRSMSSRGCGASSARWATTWQRPIRPPSPWNGTSRSGRARSSSITTGTPLARPSPPPIRSDHAPAPRSRRPSSGMSWAASQTATSPFSTSGTDSRGYGDLFAPVVAGGQTLDDAEKALGIGIEPAT